MNKLITITILVLGTVLSSFAQPGANQEAFFGYTVGYGPVKLVTPTNDLTKDRKEFTHGVTLGFTFYLHRTKDIKSNKLGIGMDVNAQFFDGLRPVFATATGGLVYKARADKKVQPFLRVMGGAARVGFKSRFVNGFGLVSTAEYSPAAVAGVGFDVAKKDSRLKWRVGVDYVRTWFLDRSQTIARGTTGIVF